MLFYRYGDLWKSFFRKLGCEVVLSKATTQATLTEGSAIALDEACLSLKIYLGHVQSLIGQCTYILIPRISNLGKDRELCPRFEALYDVTRDTFRHSEQKFLTYDVDVKKGKTEEAAFIALGVALGATHKDSKKAYSAALKDAEQLWKERVKQQNLLLGKDGLHILIAAHSYVIEDPFMGKPITTYLTKQGAIPLRADVGIREDALKSSRALSPTCPWELNREIIGGIRMYKNKVDGIILLSAFPCGTDAMVNELLLRELSGIPMLNLVLDGQSGTAGLETRLESFLDIIRFREELVL